MSCSNRDSELVTESLISLISEDLLLEQMETQIKESKNTCMHTMIIKGMKRMKEYLLKMKLNDKFSLKLDFGHVPFTKDSYHPQA